SNIDMHAKALSMAGRRRCQGDANSQGAEGQERKETGHRCLLCLVLAPSIVSAMKTRCGPKLAPVGSILRIGKMGEMLRFDELFAHAVHVGLTPRRSPG